MLELKGIRRLEEDTYFKRFVKVSFILEDRVVKRAINRIDLLLDRLESWKNRKR